MSTMKEKYHHGKTPAAWTATVIATVGALVAAVGFFLPGINWAMVWGGIGTMVASAIVGWVMVKLGYGQALVEE